MNEKACTKCEVIKHLADFNRTNQTKSGVRAICRECQRKQSLAYYHEGTGQRKKSEYYATHREEKKQGFRRHYRTNKPSRPYDPAKAPARVAVSRALKSGRLVRPESCQQCGHACKPDAHHHKGYGKEYRLDVIWLCRECHSLIEHPEFQKVLEAI